MKRPIGWMIVKHFVYHLLFSLLVFYFIYSLVNIVFQVGSILVNMGFYSITPDALSSSCSKDHNGCNSIWEQSIQVDVKWEDDLVLYYIIPLRPGLKTKLFVVKTQSIEQ